MSVKNKLFEEVFCPKNLNSFVLPQRIKDEFPNGIVEDNYLFYGTSGLGKSALAIELGKNMNTFYMNASLDGSVDSLRRGSELHNFCVTRSVIGEDKEKLVILDELNGVSKQFYEGLKGFIGEFNKIGVRFIGTTNYFEEIEPAILSRLKPINFNLSIEEEESHLKLFKARVRAILDKIKVTYDDESLDKLIMKSYPDWRALLKDLQFLHRMGTNEITESVVKKEVYQYNPIYDAIAEMNSKNDLKDLMELIRKYNNPASVIRGIDRDLFNYYSENNKRMLFLVPNYSIIIAKYNDMLSRRVDPSITLKAMIFELMTLRENSKI